VPAADGSAADVVAFERQCVALRARGCRCMLKWEDGAVPLFRAEAAQIACPVHQPEA